MNLRRLAWISLGSVVLILGVSLLFNFYISVERGKILSTQDTRLQAFDEAKSLARESAKVFSTTKSESYTRLGADLRTKWDPDLWDSYFKGVEFPVDKVQEYTEERVGVEMISPAEYYVKIDATLATPTNSIPLSTVYHIISGRLLGIENLR